MCIQLQRRCSQIWKLSEPQIDFHPFRIAKIARDLILIEFFRAKRIVDDGDGGGGSKSSSCSIFCICWMREPIRIRVYVRSAYFVPCSTLPCTFVVCGMLCAMRLLYNVHVQNVAFVCAIWVTIDLAYFKDTHTHHTRDCDKRRHLIKNEKSFFFHPQNRIKLCMCVFKTRALWRGVGGWLNSLCYSCWALRIDFIIQVF